MAEVSDLTRDQIVDRLVGDGARRDMAVQYTDAYLEYREASSNIAEHGSIVQHPRTGNPIQNPYLVVRERALKKLRAMRRINPSWLW